MTISSPRPAAAYGLATHMLIVDLLWDHSILPLLRNAFPPGPGVNYDEARRYAYSGAILQDAGYYYYRGKPEAIEEIQHFSDMTHYARSGDFVMNLFKSATDVDELAFALGALTHYVGDIEGHSLATNLSVPISCSNHFPDYSVVTYEQQPDDHLKVEFGFDVNAVKLMRLRPPSLMKHQKADLSLQQLTYAYYRTYGMHKDLTWTKDGFSARAFYASSNFILPAGTYLRARVEKRAAVQEPADTGLEAKIVSLARDEGWKRKSHYGWIPRRIARLMLHLSAKSAEIMPSPETQKKYAESLVAAVNKLEIMIASIDPRAPVFEPLWLADGASVASGPLPNMNLDTGEPEAAGTYDLSDRIHQVWLADLVSTQKNYPKWPLPASVTTSLDSFFAHPQVNWNATEVHNALDTAALLPPWPSNEPCPDQDPDYKKDFGWHMVNPQAYSYPKASRQPLCSYSGSIK